MKKRGLWIGAGILMALAMPGFNLHFFVWIGFALFLRSLDRENAPLSARSLIRNTLRGLGFGLVFFGVSLHWFLPTFAHYIPQVLRSFPPIMGAVVFLLLISVEALFYGLFAFVYTLFRSRVTDRPTLFCLFIGLLLFVTEWLRGLGPMGFPGFRFSDALVNMLGLSQLVAFGGTEALVILIGVVNAALFRILSARPFLSSSKRSWVLVALLLLSLYAADSVTQNLLPPVYPQNGETRWVGGMQTMFRSEDKYDSGTGWPSYARPIADDRVGTEEDRALFMSRTEVHCARCGGHLGHVFPDGFGTPTGDRYCMNSLSLSFSPEA